jgi:hypothetical protein
MTRFAEYTSEGVTFLGVIIIPDHTGSVYNSIFNIRGEYVGKFC